MAEETKKTGFAEKMVPSVAYGVLVGAVLYAFFGVTATVFPTLTPIIGGVIGFSAGFVISLLK